MTTTPHDALFRLTFSDPQQARGLIRGLLPAALAKRIEWQSLKAIDGSVIDKELQDQQTDLLFEAKLADKPILFYLLLEHQSSADPIMPMRMLMYMTRIWERLRREDPTRRRFPLIMPMVVHHSALGWRAPTQLSEVLEIDDGMIEHVRAFVPDFCFRLYDLTSEQDAAILDWLETDLSKLVLLMLKHAAYDRDFPLRFIHWAELVRRVARAPGGLTAWAAVARYLFLVTEVGATEVQNVIKKHVDGTELEVVVTAAEQLLAQGRVEGRAEGRAEGQAQLILTMLRLRFGPLSDGVIAHVQNATIAELEAMAARVLIAQCAEDIIAP